MHLCRKDKVPIRKLVFYFDASGIQAAEVWASAIDFFRQAGILHTEYSLTFPALVRKGGPALVVSSEEALAVLQEESPTMFTLGHDAGNASQRIMLSPMSGSRRFYNFPVPVRFQLTNFFFPFMAGQIFIVFGRPYTSLIVISDIIYFQ